MCNLSWVNLVHTWPPSERSRAVAEGFIRTLRSLTCNGTRGTATLMGYTPGGTSPCATGDFSAQICWLRAKNSQVSVSPDRSRPKRDPSRGLLGIVVFRAIRAAQMADDMFGMLVAAGVAVWFVFQSFVNIGMTVGIMPITGLPLPFVSYGGSAIFADMIAVGLLQSVRRHHSLFT